ncbi:MAG: peptidoglycan DD-metalloendopeptidase family protein, partial [Candidatus Hydrogenedentes bacterium]|nr:peptidoglycan DD-metalloendopeptidase family protein [Candidatus Hydrogenedentota bacterium]
MALLCFLLTAFGAEEPYHWPLDLPRALTSSFGEYRSGRFHMGIDLRTGGIGKPVFAAADGYVSRLRCSPYGYGKAVYLQLNDGHTAVYGHLDGFIPEYESYLRAAQHAREDYTVDLYPEAARFPVTKGQLIAYSGDTGVGVPHLHYELREGADCINPRLLDVDWPDTTRPEIRKILIAPRAPGDYVNGDILPLVVEPKSLGGGRYQCAPVSVSGTVGFGMDLVDPANGGATKLDIYRIEARVGDTLLFRSQRDRLSYDTYSGGAVTWHPFLMDQGRFQLLWQWPGNDAGIITTAINSGWLEMGAEPLV